MEFVHHVGKFTRKEAARDKLSFSSLLSGAQHLLPVMPPPATPLVFMDIIARTFSNLPAPAKRPIPAASWIFLIAFAVRLLVLTRVTDSQYLIATSGDMKFYSDWALRIASGHFTDHRAFYGLPGYPFFLGGVFFLFGFNPFVVGFLQAAAEAGTAVLIFAIARLIAPGQKGLFAGGLAAAGWIFFQPAQAFSAVLMPTSWLVLAFWGIVWWSMRTPARSVWRPWLCVGMATGLVATMVATIFFAIPLPAAAAVRNLRKPGAILTAFASLIVGVLIGTAPCWLHNYFIAGEPVLLSAHSGINFWIGNNPVANGYPKMPSGLRASQEGMLKDSIRLAEAAAGHPLTRAEVSRYWSAKANAYIHGHTREWLALMAIKGKNLWNAFQYDDLSLVTPLSEDGILTPGLRFGMVAALAIPGLLFAWRYRRSRWVVAAVGLHMAALLPVFVTERYRLAAVPGLLIVGSIGLIDLWDSLAQRKPGWLRAAALYGGLALAGAWFVSLPQRDTTLWPLDDYNSGIKALAANNLDRAQEKLERAFAYAPENNEINFVLGNLWLKRHDRERAKHFYMQAIKFSPHNERGELEGSVGALNNFAVLEIDEQAWDFANYLLTAALRVEPDDAKIHFMLAYTGYSRGDRNAAKAEIAKAIALQPLRPEFEKLRDEIAAGQQLSPFPFQP
jgi:hypothetical protein